MTEQPNQAAVTEDFEFAALNEAVNYRAALVTEFAPVLRGTVVEIGAGIGQISAALASLPAVEKLVCIEPDAGFCQRFRQRQPAISLLESTIDAYPVEAGCDAIVSVNVLEHIREDSAELEKYHARLVARVGHLCLFVPARQEIYAPIDGDFGHHRRYSRPALQKKLEAAGFTIVRLHYFNWIGYFAWWASFCVLRRRTFDPASVRFFDRGIFPLIHAFERKVLRPPFGQSLMAIARAGSPSP